MDRSSSANSAITTPDLASSSGNEPVQNHCDTSRTTPDLTAFNEHNFLPVYTAGSMPKFNEADRPGFSKVHSTNTAPMLTNSNYATTPKDRFTSTAPKLKNSSLGPTAPEKPPKWRFFTDNEYDLLLVLHSQGKSWEEIHERLPGRDEASCNIQLSTGRRQWGKYRVRSSGKKLPWHGEEIAVLTKALLENGNKLDTFRYTSGLLPARTVDACRNRWNIHECHKHNKDEPSVVGHQQLEVEHGVDAVPERPGGDCVDQYLRENPDCCDGLDPNLPFGGVYP